MLINNEHITIDKNIATNDGLDFAFLRQQGIAYIEALAKDLWTDYNIHDPGITILEMLAYAITDLTARIEMPMEDILAREPNSENQDPLKCFFEAHDILPSKPVSENDYRKLFLDLQGVNNCWVLPYKQKLYVNCENKKLSYEQPAKGDKIKHTDLRGLYEILIDFKDYLSGDEISEIKEKIKKRYHENRNLCEDLVEVKTVETFPVVVCGSIELENDADKEKVHAKILWEIDQYFSPPVRFYSLKEMFRRGYSTEEIFDGPYLDHGFIDYQELEASKLREEVRLSDLMNRIMRIDGVKVIKDLIIEEQKNENQANTSKQNKNWIIYIPEGKKPIRCEKCSVFSYYKDVLPLNINKRKAETYRKQLKEEAEEALYITSTQNTLDIPSGSFRNVGDTTTIQNDFPETYGIGYSGLPANATETRKAQAKQLKGYLLFFDQILANYFAHLSKIKEIFAVDNRLRQTYFTQAINDVKDFSDLVAEYPKDDPEALYQALLGELDDPLKRNNQILDHLIARFAEKFGKYAFLMEQLYGAYADEIVLRDKRTFLKAYNRISKTRGNAFNYYQQPESEIWNTDNVSGFQKRIAHLTGITNYKRRNLCDSFLEVYSQNGKLRWRFRDIHSKIVLTSTEDYATIRAAEREIYLVLARIMETSEKEIEAAFKKDAQGNYLMLEKDLVFGNLLVRFSDGGRYSFNVIDPEGKGKDWIIARQYSYYKKPEDFKKSILEFIRFIKEEFSEEGMFVIENILLRPDVDSKNTDSNCFLPIGCDGCEDDCDCFDPYSYRITIVLPGWTMRFWNMDYRAFLENLIRQELPAHVLPRICWVGYRKNEDLLIATEKDSDTTEMKSNKENDMENLEKAFHDFLSDLTQTGKVQETDNLVQLIGAINSLNTIYHSGRLLDCDDDDESLTGRIILGRTNIGNP